MTSAILGSTLTSQTFSLKYCCIYKQELKENLPNEAHIKKKENKKTIPLSSKVKIQIKAMSVNYIENSKMAQYSVE